MIGLDEVGRGPLAGPVGVGGVLCLPDFFVSLLPSWTDEINDSKKLSAGLRERLALLILSHPHIVSATSLVSAKIIDKYGIVYAIRKASKEVIKFLRCEIERRDTETSSAGHKATINIVLDGKNDYGLRKEFPDLGIETIVKGDQKIWQIAAASIIAKVTRDAYMEKISHKRKYAVYGFQRHKGYGTLAHRQAIFQYGLTDEHRQTFCKKLLSQY